MKNKNSKIEKMKVIAAKRLSEVMLLKGMESPSKIIKKLEEEYNYPMQRQTYYKYQKAVNSMPQEFIEKVSEILDIDKGYLEGKDSFFCDSYEEYIGSIQQIDMFDANIPDYKRYSNFLKFADLWLSYGTTSDDSDIEYGVTDKDNLKKRCSFTSSEMESLYQDCIKMIRKKFYPDDQNN